MSPVFKKLQIFLAYFISSHIGIITELQASLIRYTELMDKSLQIKINIAILIALIISFIFHPLLIAIGILSTIPVIISTIKSLRDKKVSVDLLASIALIASILHREWASVAFINLMITSARIFGNYTESKADDAIKSLLKLRPEIVKIKSRNAITKF